MQLKKSPQNLGEIANRVSESTTAFVMGEKAVIRCLEDLSEFLFEMDMCCQDGGDGRNKDYEKDHKEVIFRKVALALHLYLYNLCLCKTLGKEIEAVNEKLTLIRSLIFRISGKIDPSSEQALESKLEIFGAK